MNNKTSANNIETHHEHRIIANNRTHDHDEDGHDGHDHGAAGGSSSIREHIDLIAALAILVVVLILEYGFNITFSQPVSLTINLAAYLLSGWKVLRMAWRKATRGDVFNEFVLMSVATIGAFIIKEYPEGVAVMVFYSIGEWFQDAAVNRAKANIKKMLDIRPEEVTVIREGKAEMIHPSAIAINEKIQVKPGEKVALDGLLLSDSASFNTAALTGESKPDTKYKGDPVLAGMVNLNTVVEITVTTLFRDSKLSQILDMVRDATARKSETQLFISRFAKIYTPIVFFLALAVAVLPVFFVESYVFQTWFYRALVFLVISCPCGLVVSIPLGYFGGIGLAARNGILLKGGNFLDALTKVDTIVMDKTGTLTKGVFKVRKVVAAGMSETELVKLIAALESASTHPIARAIVEYAGDQIPLPKVDEMEEIAGHGLSGNVEGKTILAGNVKLLEKYGIPFPDDVRQEVDTIVVTAVNDQYTGYITIADEVREDAREAVAAMHSLKLRTVMLSGDKQRVVDKVAKETGIQEAYGDLLPDGKVKKVTTLKANGAKIAFAGDGVNDAPVVALADVGIAMGGLGSDATIETADVVIQNDMPSRIVTAIRCGKITRNIVWQNIILAMSVKIAVLVLGASGVATLWEAVIADVGVALLSIINAVRIQRTNMDD
ncbi:heavy metal translocating P-type ATPase [Chitinophaga agri]|uniref:P-type Zn(2+) transporter n=1 Tax=Chitinophaga agri TaxID=2703787 RepID=A0A6B9ZMT7_9BACT|nr:heavy metal translocating P-type ATPase [Chitinophaga agri]QHS63562.1 cadmium-translocating P-type ATPase [Chitinophaga agri]